MGFRVNSIVLGERYWQEGASLLELAKAYEVDDNTVWRRMVGAGIRRRPPGNRLRGRWSHRWQKCRECGTTEVAHKARGLCLCCYERLVRYPRKRDKKGGERR